MSDTLADFLLRDSRVQVDVYVVRPTGYDDLVQSDRDTWCLDVVNGHAWGWSVRAHGVHGHRAMNRKGEWVYEPRGSGRNKPRRWAVEEALAIALAHVDTHTLNGMTAQEASDEIARRLSAPVSDGA